MASHMEMCRDMTRMITNFERLTKDLRKESENNKRGLYMKLGDLSEMENLVINMKSLVDGNLFKMLSESEENKKRMIKAETVAEGYKSMVEACYSDLMQRKEYDKCNDMKRFSLTLQ